MIAINKQSIRFLESFKDENNFYFDQKAINTRSIRSDFLHYECAYRAEYALIKCQLYAKWLYGLVLVFGKMMTRAII